MNKFKIELTEKELEHIQTSLAFASCVQSCWKGTSNDQIDMAKLAERIHKENKVVPNKSLYLYDSENKEDIHTFQILEKFTRTKKE